MNLSERYSFMKHKTLVIVDSQEDLSRLRLEKQEGDLRIINIGNTSWGKNVRPLGYYTKQKQVFDSREEALKWMKSWPGLKIDGKSFKELLAYDNTSLWWFTEFWFWNAHSPHDSSILDIFHSIEIAERILSSEKPSSVVISGESLLCSVISLVAKARDLEVSFIQNKNFRKNMDKKIRPTLVKEFKNIKEFLRKIPKRKILHKKPRKINILMFTHPTYRQNTIDVGTGKNIVEDITLGPVMKELQDCYITVVDTDPFATFRLDFTFSSPGYNHLESYTNKVIEEKVFKEEKILKEKWNSIEPFLKKVLMHRNIELMPLLEQKFLEMFHRKFLDAVKYIELAKEAVRIERPDVLIVVDECGLYGRAAVFAGEQAGILTYAIQHGLIGASSIEYMHTTEELQNGLSPLHNIIPDKTLVTSEYYNNLLVEFGYRKDSVVTTGQPKYDILAKVGKIFDKEKTRLRFGLKPEDKMLVFASQPLPREENEILMRSLFNAVKKISGLKLVIKLHPNEYDSSLHESVAKEVGIDVSIIKDINISEILYACDVLINVSSTVTDEAMRLNKPVIIANLTGKPDDTPYVKMGVAIGVYKDNDMVPAIRKVFFDKKIRKKMEEHRKKFVFEIDGLASKRIAEFIKKTVNVSEKVEQ
jgi:glycosyltransferase involved in cell wall biosynthesis